MFPLQLELDKEGISFVQVSPSISNVHQSSVNSHINFLHFYPKSFKQRGTIRRHRLRGNTKRRASKKAFLMNIESLGDRVDKVHWCKNQIKLAESGRRISQRKSEDIWEKAKSPGSFQRCP